MLDNDKDVKNKWMEYFNEEFNDQTPNEEKLNKLFNGIKIASEKTKTIKKDK